MAAQETVNRKVLARFSDVCEKQFSSLGTNRDRITRYLQEMMQAYSRSALQEASGLRNRETRKGKEGMLYNRKSSAENVTVNALFTFLVTLIGVYVSEKCDYHIVTALSVAI